MVTGSSSYYPHHSHPNQMISQQNFAGNPWAQSSNASTGQASGFNSQHYPHNPGLYQNPPVEVHGNQDSANKVNMHPPQPEWRVEPQQSQPVSQSLASGNSSQPYFPSNPASQVSDWPRRDSQSASSQPFNHSLPGSDYSTSDARQQKHLGSFVTHFPTPVNNAQSTASYQMARSNSHQAAFPHHGPGNVAGLPSHEYSQHPHPPNQYSNSMTRSQSGTNFDSMVYAPGPEHQNNAQFYQNPFVQAGMHQYQSHPQPSQPVSNMLPHGVYQNAHSTSQQEQWTSTNPRLSRVSGSDPQFISGPWGSTPPT
ncbi:hypothetical protein N7478_010444 [Penicillium angulare]|uniref:uncharacterized protein n=1 Tax=Penicillium angulare TaxID=116970 RepID=UPI00253F6B25|nr:uncharacterized protein N7478_010444 [Penicillium angulare]KAJ5267636.1 hypothetical protein N7478_010444 [Penicillium angulare]